eukprot:1523682-Pyramimonas_sp.AAC.1
MRICLRFLCLIGPDCATLPAQSAPSASEKAPAGADGAAPARGPAGARIYPRFLCRIGPS